MAVRFQLRRDTAANWASANSVLALGEPGVETDTLKVKVGDGSTAWNSLAYSITKDFTDLTSTPTTLAGYGITDALSLAVLSVGAEATAAGDGAIAYNNATGVFTYTPPDTSTFLTTVAYADLTSKPTTLSGYGITDAATTAQGALADSAVQPGNNIETSIIDSADSSAITITPDVVMSAGLTVGNHIIPSSNENIDLGSDTNRFRELFLSGSTISLDGIKLSSTGTALRVHDGTNTKRNIESHNIDANDVTVNNITTAGYLRGPASFVIDPAAFGDDTGTVVIAGNLQVDGVQTTINSTTVSIDDLNFSIATDAADSAAANGAGITVGGAGATLNYTHATTSWDMNKPLNVTGNIGVTGTVDGVDIQTLNTTAGAALPKAGGTMTGTLSVNTGGSDANSVSNLSGDFSTWIRVGDMVGGSGQTQTNGYGIKFADAGVIHWSVGGQGSNFKISKTNTLGDELFPSGSRDDITITSAGQVGIGTNTPDTLLHVQQSVDTSSGGIQVRNSADASGMFLYVDSTNHGQIDMGSSGHLQFRTGSTDRVIIEQTGDVGIGLANPLAKLHVNGDIVVGSGDSNQKIYLEGAVNDLNMIHRNTSENTTIMTARHAMAFIIDSNADDSDTGSGHFTIRKNGTTVAGSNEMFKILPNGDASFYGNHLQLPKSAANPTGTSSGQLYYDTTNNAVKFYDGTSWRLVNEIGVRVTSFDVFGDSSSVALYQLNANGNDTGGNANLSINGSSFGTGKFGNAWNGTGTNTAYSGHSSLNISGDYSVSFWYKSSTTAQSNKRLVTLKGANITAGWNNYNGSLGFYIGGVNLGGSSTSVTRVSQIPDSQVNDGSWHHLAFSVTSSGSWVIYLDGTSYSGAVSGEGRSFNSNTYFAITSYDTGSGYNTIGLVDQVRIFNRVISAGEVAQLYNTSG